MGNLCMNLVDGSIPSIVKFYILNKDALDIERQKEKYKDDHSLLDNAAIFLRILVEKIQGILDDYARIHDELDNLVVQINGDIERLHNLEREIDDLLEVRSSKSAFSLGIDTLKIPVKRIFLGGKVDRLDDLEMRVEELKDLEMRVEELKDLEMRVEELKKFHVTLLSNYGRHDSALYQDSLVVKLGCMFQYFELSNLLLDKISEVLESLKSYKRCSEEKEKFDNNLNKAVDDIVRDLGKMYSLDDELLSKVIDDVQKFLGMDIKNAVKTNLS